VALDSPFNHCEQGKLVIPRMKFEPLIDNEEQHIAEMAAYFREQVESKKYPGMLVLFASGRAMQRFLEHVTDLRLLLLVQGISRATGWWKPTVSALITASAACWWGCSRLLKVWI
jgi:ATP-dependent DNA helicase DinG